MIFDKDLILLYLSNEAEVNGHIVKSPYLACLQDARNATERDSDGRKKTGRHASWLGAMGYAVLVDQIGGKFKIADFIKEERLKKINVGNNDFIKTLIYFSKLTDEEILALYAWRCSFVHDYFLFNKNEKDGRLSHYFSVIVGQPGEVVTLPLKKWDGKLENVKEENKTTINLELFGDLAEEIHKKLLNYAKKEKLIIQDREELGFLTYLRQ